jgi:hypothetical protein
MASNDDYSEWDEEDIAGLDDESYERDGDEDSPMSELQKSMFESRVIGTFVRNAYEFGGTNTLLEVLSCVERKMGWRTEIIADKNALDDYMFYRHETFDEEIWSYYANSDQYSELIHKVAFLSEHAMSDFVELYSKSGSPKKRFRKQMRNIAWKVFKKLSQ